MFRLRIGQSKQEKGMSEEQLDYGTFEATLERSRKLEEIFRKGPGRIRYSQGTGLPGRLHIGHLFGSVQNRVRLHRMGVPTFIVIADYQVLTDRDTFENISENIRQLAIDYMSSRHRCHRRENIHISSQSCSGTQPTAASVSDPCDKCGT